MSSHNSIPVPMGSDSAGSSGPRRRRRKQWLPKGRPSDVRRRALRAERRLEEEARRATLERADERRRVAAVTHDAAISEARRRREAKPDVSRRVRRTAAMINETHGSVSAKVAEDLVDRCRTQGERRAAAILGAELWRKQVTKVVLSIADKVDGIVNMVGAELAELGLTIEALKARVQNLETSVRNLSSPAVMRQLARPAKKRRQARKAKKRRQARKAKP